MSEKKGSRPVETPFDEASLKEKLTTSLHDHLDVFNDAVIAIIITIIVLEIPVPKDSLASYFDFLRDIANFLASFVIVDNFWYDGHKVFNTFEKATKSVMIANFFYLAMLSLIPVMTKWVIHSSSKLALFNYGIVYLLIEMSLFFIFVAGNFDSIKQAGFQHSIAGMTLTRFGLILLPLTLIIMFLPKLTLVLYLILPLVSLLVPEQKRRRPRRENKKEH